ncbi:DUF3971 domain-containing protein [Vibrio zhanjiangensis]|uniref:DUF3971 domain-containing protein n=1 Tax=Vibrio zhanjiangensis TaxID=1046128 RepID=A0ABQ6EWM9_9VIBR|nr:DUF3971 domain-containing protein [Vibrio zhanjiangensis]
MNRLTAQLILRGLAWLTVVFFVTLAVMVTTLRIALPQLNHFKSEIQQWVNQGSELDFEIEQISGFWRNTHPSISLKNVQANTPEASGIHFSVQTVEVEFDLVQSLLDMRPVIADLSMYNLNLDLSSIAWAQSGESKVLQPKTEQKSVIEKLDQLLLRQLDSFLLQDSLIRLQGIDGSVRDLDISQLFWQNKGRRHIADGEVSITGTNLNSAKVKANFVDHGSLAEVSGEFYLAVDNVLVTPWLTQYLQTETGIEKGQVSLNTWITLEHNQPVNAYLELEPSELIWKEGQQHELLIESGILQLEPTRDGWQVNARALKLRTDDEAWPELDFALRWQPERWSLNISQLDLKAIAPLAKLFPDSKQASQMLETLNLTGRLEDIRLSMNGTDLDSLRYSLQLSDGGIKQWELLPGVHHLSANLSGNRYQAQSRVSIIDDVLPYGQVFQAPLNIKQGELDIVWQSDSRGWSLWADKVTAATADLQVLGAFRLDFPIDKSPFLSFYAEADLYNAGQTWRYLPALALGRDLTDYLSSGIQAGKVKTAKLLWYGELEDFPYSNNDGVFQAWVGLEDAKFSFDTAWPTITDLQLDLLFQNDALYLDSHRATLTDIKASRITGRIPRLGPGGHIEIEASATAQGNSVRDYMMSSPLVDSVGAALTAVQVKGEVKSSFKLNIPFDSEAESRAWGYADLTEADVAIKTPAINLEKVSGRIEFDNDVVSAAGLTGKLLEQSVALDFRGENAERGYDVNIDVLGDWELKPLTSYLGKRWIDPVNGHVPWQMGIGIQLTDVGFSYQIDTKADLKMVASRYPYPLNKSLNQAWKARMQASGNQESISARLQLPNLKYQTEIDIRPDIPELKATNLILGKGSFKISPISGHQAQVRLDKLNFDQWIDLVSTPIRGDKAALDKINTPEIPVPHRIDVNVEELTLGGIWWNDVDFRAKRKNLGWHMSLESQEAAGEANYIEPYDLSVSLERLHVYVPALDKEYKDVTLFKTGRDQNVLISDFERSFHQNIPNITLAIDDFWMQGYKVGKVLLDLERHGEVLEWKKLNFESGNNKVDMSGSWRLGEQQSHTQFTIKMSGENNSDIMERFGITSGIQQAPFDLDSKVEWDGSPWSMKISTLEGHVAMKLGKGQVSGASGAARLLGLFSLDSIIRKMQLDFSDVFDGGLAFNSIKGSGDIKNGIFLTNDIKMDALAGEMTIKGLANLNSKTVDAEVNFVPDITSGIPVLTAFAVTPTTALYVLAITTVISPVVEVFTQVNYEVKGPLDNPEVKELSRSKGEFELPKGLREAINRENK